MSGILDLLNREAERDEYFMSPFATAAFVHCRQDLEHWGIESR